MATTKESESVPVFDTRGYVRTLTREGSFSEKQANANADGLQKALLGVATKMDVHFQALQEQIRALRQTMVVGFSVVTTLVLVSTLLLGLG